MDKAKNTVIRELWEMLNGIGGISETGQVSHDQLLYLRIFKQAQKNGVKFGGDAIADAIYSCYGDEMKESHKKALSNLVTSWREWNFFLENYEKV